MYNFDTWEYYKSFSLNYYNSVNGCINKVCYTSNLEIVGDCYVNANYGEISFPNTIRLFLKTILDDYNDRDSICSIIVFVITHELFHIDYHMSALAYSRDIEYRKVVEHRTDSAAYKFILQHKSLLEQLFKFNFKLPSQYIPELTTEFYPRSTIEDFYIQSIVNLIVRDIDMYPFFVDLFSKYNIVFFSINGCPKIALKFEGGYPICNMENFTDIVNKYTANDLYTMKLSIGFGTWEGEQYAHIQISITDRIIEPIVY